jgi:predicted nucleic acid-binding protein
MTLVFDTSILISIERNDISVINRLRELSQSYPVPAQITFINYYEFLRGIKIKKPKNSEKLMSFLNKFKILSITKKTADILSDIKTEYDNQGIALSLADLLIASQVIENNFILVTKDSDFSKIKELKKIIL